MPVKYLTMFLKVDTLGHNQPGIERNQWTDIIITVQSGLLYSRSIGKICKTVQTKILTEIL